MTNQWQYALETGYSGSWILVWQDPSVDYEFRVQKSLNNPGARNSMPVEEFLKLDPQFVSGHVQNKVREILTGIKKNANDQTKAEKNPTFGWELVKNFIRKLVPS